MTAQSSPPAGWYSDPADMDQQRYWDGSNWTSHTHPTQTSPTFPNPGGAETASNAGHAPGFFRSLFDLKMQPDQIVTTRFARFLYIAVNLITIATWVGLGGISLFIGIYERDSLSVFIGFVILVTGWLPALITIVATRIALDFILDNMRASLNNATLIRQARALLDNAHAEPSTPTPDEPPLASEEEAIH